LQKCSTHLKKCNHLLEKDATKPAVAMLSLAQKGVGENLASVKTLLTARFLGSEQ